MNLMSTDIERLLQDIERMSYDNVAVSYDFCGMSSPSSKNSSEAEFRQ